MKSEISIDKPPHVKTDQKQNSFLDVSNLLFLQILALLFATTKVCKQKSNLFISTERQTKMASHRIKKYSRQVMCQDCVLSCQPNTIEEIPFLRRAKISMLSLREETTTSASRSTYLARDLELAGMLMCWHLWNSRGVPRKGTKRKTDIQRRTGTERGGTHNRVVRKVCDSQLNLRDGALYTAIEKYLLFLMPREMRRERTIDIVKGRLLSRRDRFKLSALYMHTALGLCHYILKEMPSQSMCDSKRERDVPLSLIDPASLALATRRIDFPLFFDSESQTSLARAHIHGVLQNSLLSSAIFSVQAADSGSCGVHDAHTRVHSCSAYPPARLNTQTLSLYCPSTLNSPDIQDIAQSGLLTLGGSLTLELS